jgi:hypothetical protein
MRIRRRRGLGLGLLLAFLLSPSGCAGTEIDWPAIAQIVFPTLAAGPAPDLTPGAADATAPALPAPVVATLAPTAPAAPAAIEATPTEPSAYPAGPATVESLPSPAPGPTATPTPAADPVVSLIGNSAGGRAIHSYRFGSGDTDVVLVGGMHGGYEWNTILLAQAFIDAFTTGDEELPAGITLHIAPNANPDGLAAVTGGDGPFQPTDVISDTLAGRVNANGVDLNRNWDCNWSEQAFWRDQPISGGAYPFSEPESESLRRFFLDVTPAVVVFLHSAAGAVYSAGCPEPGPTSSALAAVYGLAAGYPVYPSFDHYAITGDASDWLTTQGIPSFTVELSTHETTDWEQNLAGLRALLAHLSEE